MCVYGRLAPACWCKIEVWLGKGGVAQTYCSSGCLTAFAKFVEKMTKCRASDEQFWNNYNKCCAKKEMLVWRKQGQQQI